MGDFTTAGEVESVTAHEVINTISVQLPFFVRAWPCSAGGWNS